MKANYLALARKYRPLNFDELVGQTYTKQALINALDSGNLHHGFLFTGTRGVGKTTIARILAKSFNCEAGTSSKPCGTCSTCLEIDRGECLDVIEIDAASNTGIDEMRTLLENAQYTPSKNRFKIYIIDEVHMLSLNSFNALLKTLEEPPEHIKFIFATTDPQKLPITILSRCLQFNLQHISDEEIVAQLEKILTLENITFERDGLELIASFSAGSLRDSLSILDQAIAFSDSNITAQNVQKMLGVASNENTLQIVEALFDNNPHTIHELIEKNYQNGTNLEKLLETISNMLYQIANYKACNIGDESIATLADKVDEHELQIFYQISINSLRDIKFAPSEKAGLQMSLLRMLSVASSKKKA